MNDYIEITIPYQLPEQQDLLIAQLTSIGFDGFEEGEKCLKAYIAEEKFKEELVKDKTGQHKLPYSISVVKEQNWNQLWESDFEPVIMDDFCAVRADFHAEVRNVQHDIVITPKMSFGTGHHATTYMMMAAMRKIVWMGKSVFDFGTGTGVLAILAEKLGAARITAIDNDRWCIENASENLRVNKTVNIDLYHADALPAGQHFNIILANINKNSILEHLTAIASHLQPDGLILISGILQNDVIDVLEAAGNVNLKQTGLQERNNWICLQLMYSEQIS